VWCSILAWIGYSLGRHEGVLRNSEVQHYVSRALLIVLPVLALVVWIYVVRQRRRTPAGDGG
jgi:membrane protein DedA with SNARE-associated domain